MNRLKMMMDDSITLYHIWDLAVSIDQPISSVPQLIIYIPVEYYRNGTTSVKKGVTLQRDVQIVNTLIVNASEIIVPSCYLCGYFGSFSRTFSSKPTLRPNKNRMFLVTRPTVQITCQRRKKLSTFWRKKKKWGKRQNNVSFCVKIGQSWNLCSHVWMM